MTFHILSYLTTRIWPQRFQKPQRNQTTASVTKLVIVTKNLRLVKSKTPRMMESSLRCHRRMLSPQQIVTQYPVHNPLYAYNAHINMNSGSHYVPPHLRNQSDVNEKDSELMIKLTRQLKGLLNRWAFSKISFSLTSDAYTEWANRICQIFLTALKKPIRSIGGMARHLYSANDKCTLKINTAI